jgi:hypothetical protein
VSELDRLRAHLCGLQLASTIVACNEALNHARTLRDEAAPESEDKAAYRAVAEGLEDVAQRLQKVRGRLDLR